MLDFWSDERSNYEIPFKDAPASRARFIKQLSHGVLEYQRTLMSMLQTYYFYLLSSAHDKNFSDNRNIDKNCFVSVIY